MDDILDIFGEYMDVALDGAMACVLIPFALIIAIGMIPFFIIGTIIRVCQDK